MKLTKSHLQKIIKEEVEKELSGEVIIRMFASMQGRIADAQRAVRRDADPDIETYASLGTTISPGLAKLAEDVEILKGAVVEKLKRLVWLDPKGD